MTRTTEHAVGFAEELARLMAKYFGGLAGGAPTMPLAESASAFTARAPMALDVYLEERFLPERLIAAKSAYQYRIKVRQFSEWLGRPATLSDLNEPTINRYLDARLALVKRETVRGNRAHLIALWNGAYDARLIANAPTRVKRLRREGRKVEGWTMEELARLLEQCKNPPGRPITGRFQGKNVVRSDYWRALVLFGYDTGLRLGDVMRVRLVDLRFPEPFVLVMHKTRKPISLAMRPETWEAIGKLKPAPTDPIFRVMERRYFHTAFRRLIEAAGLKGSFQYLRRTSGSIAESIQAGAGSKHLGHRDPTIFDRHYNVRSLTEKPPMLLPPIAPLGQQLSKSEG